jgi:hypothetical protein
MIVNKTTFLREIYYSKVTKNYCLNNKFFKLNIC